MGSFTVWGGRWRWRRRRSPRRSLVAQAANPLAVEVREAVDESTGAPVRSEYSGTGPPRQLGLAVDGALEAARQARLRGAGEHDGGIYSPWRSSISSSVEAENRSCPP